MRAIELLPAANLAPIADRRLVAATILALAGVALCLVPFVVGMLRLADLVDRSTLVATLPAIAVGNMLVQWARRLRR